MKKLLLILFLLMPVAVFAQTDVELPDGSTLEVYLALPEAGQEPLPLAIVMGGGPGNGRVAENTFELLGQQSLADSVVHSQPGSWRCSLGHEVWVEGADGWSVKGVLTEQAQGTSAPLRRAVPNDCTV